MSEGKKLSLSVHPSPPSPPPSISVVNSGLGHLVYFEGEMEGTDCAFKAENNHVFLHLYFLILPVCH